jgi:hypothetical protein
MGIRVSREGDRDDLEANICEIFSKSHHHYMRKARTTPSMSPWQRVLLTTSGRLDRSYAVLRPSPVLVMEKVFGNEHLLTWRADSYSPTKQTRIVG